MQTTCLRLLHSSVQAGVEPTYFTTERPRTTVPVGLLRPRSTVLTLGGICVPPTVNYLQYLVTGSTLTAVRPFKLPAPQSGTLSQILSGTRPSVQTVLGICLKRICSLDTSVFSALEVPDDNCALSIYLLTYLLTTSWLLVQCATCRPGATASPYRYNLQ